MLEAIISKNRSPVNLSQEPAERQGLPKSAAFSDLLKARQSDYSVKSNEPRERVTSLMIADDLTAVSNLNLAESEGEDAREMMSLTGALPSNLDLSEQTTTLDQTMVSVTMPDEQMANTLAADSESLEESSEAIMGLSSGLTDELGVTLNDDMHFESAVSGSVNSDDIFGTVVLPGGQQSALAPAFGSAVSERVNSDDIIGSVDLSEEQPLALDPALDEELVLGQGLIMPEQVAEKGLVTGSGEKLGDRTAELRQEARAIKLGNGSEQATQAMMTQKNATSDDLGQQSRGQSSQQQFLNMAQSVSQNTQGVREQQVERQFTQVLNERVANQALGEMTAERLNSRSTGSESRAQLPVGLQSIGLPVTHQKWGQALGQRMVYMANQQMQQAQITLNPEKLGPVQIRLQIDRDQKVNVVMTAQHGVTREAMEAAMPRLKEMFEQAGIDLGSVDVNDQKQFENEEQEHAETQQASSNDNEDLNEHGTDGALAASTYSTDNVVDYYA